MIEVCGFFWKESHKYDVLCVTTNGCRNKRGCLIMGKGIALEFKLRYPGIDLILGQKLKWNGNIPTLLEIGGTHVLTFPTKTHWSGTAKLDLIEQSAERIVHIINKEFLPTVKVLMPRPGCGLGRLNWEDVGPILENYFDDRFTIIHV